MNEITDETSKFVDCKIKLNSVDVSNLSLSDQIAITGNNYRINAIKDYAADDSVTTQVELVRRALFLFTTDPAIVSINSIGPIEISCGSFTFEPTITTDNDGVDITSYLWSQVSGPNTATIESPTSEDTVVTNLAVGTYVFELSVLTNYGLTTVGTRSVVVEAHTIAPTVTATNNGPITLPTSTFTLTGTATPSSCATIASTLWSLISGPGSISIVSPSSFTTNVTGVTASGSYEFGFVATDNFGLTGTGTTTVTVNAEVTVFIENTVSAMNIISVAGISGLTPTFSGISGDGTYSGFHSAFTGTIAISVFGTIGGGCSAELFKNNVLVDCLNFSSSGTQTFSSDSYLSTDVIKILFVSGSC